MMVPKLDAWGARALYLGPAFGLTAHRNAVALLACGVDAKFGVADDPRDASRGYRHCRSAFIPANTLHHLECGAATMAFLYVDALSSDSGRLLGLARHHTPTASFDLVGEAEFIRIFRQLADGRIDRRNARAQLAARLIGGPPRAPDERVAAALANLHANPSEPHSLQSLAEAAGLSTSRFIHLFKETTGVQFRRYRIWARMSSAVRALRTGSDLTSAALNAGFASSAHFSATYREMFGMAPSRLLRKGRPPAKAGAIRTAVKVKAGA